MENQQKTESALATHLSVTVLRDGQPIGCDIRDIAGRDYPQLRDQVAWSVLQRRPELAGMSWSLGLRIEGEGTASVVVAEAFLKDEASDVLASVNVPLANVEWIAQGIAARLESDGDVRNDVVYLVGIHSADSPAVRQWDAAGNEDFEILEEQSELTLPTGFETGSPGLTRIIDDQETWLSCVFTPRAWEEFLDAASLEREAERHWAGLGHVCVTPQRLYTVIERIKELPGQATESSIVTRAADWATEHGKMAEDLIGYLHLHPQAVQNVALSPSPSANDSVVAWNISLAASPRPPVFPIAMFGTNPQAPQGSVAAWGYERGLLAPIRLEVFKDD